MMLAARRNFTKVTKVIVPNLCLLSLFPFPNWKHSRDCVVTRADNNLSRRGRGCDPGRVREVEEFCHVHLGGVPRGEIRCIKPGFNELQYRGEIRDRVRDVMPLSKR